MVQLSCSRALLDPKRLKIKGDDCEQLIPVTLICYIYESYGSMWGLILKPAMFGVCVDVYWEDTAVLSDSDFMTFIIIIEPALLNCTRHIIVLVSRDTVHTEQCP